MAADASAAAVAAAAVAENKATMKALLARKAQIDDDLKNTERQIYDMEETYITDTAHYGNVIKGWEGFNNSKPKMGHTVRKAKILDKDRIFSESSTTAPKVIPF